MITSQFPGFTELICSQCKCAGPVKIASRDNDLNRVRSEYIIRNKPHRINLCRLLQHVFLCASFSRERLLRCLYTWHTHTTNSERIEQLRPVSDMAENDGIFYCDCPRYCKTRKRVSSSTWYNHKKYRDNVTIPFGAFEAAAGAGTSAVPAAPPLEQPQLYAETSGRPLRKRQRQNGPESNANVASANQEVNIILLFS
jgi:hypothetical protein